MEVKDVKTFLGKEVYYRAKKIEKEHKYILSAYIYRIDEKDNSKRVSQVELKDNNAVVIAPISEVRAVD